MPPTLMRSSSKYFPNGTGCLTPREIVPAGTADLNVEAAYTPQAIGDTRALWEATVVR
jgi:hypothetical protein